MVMTTSTADGQRHECPGNGVELFVNDVHFHFFPIVASQHFGADREKSSSNEALGIIFFLFAEPIFAAMTNEHAVRAVGAPAFKIMALIQPFLALGIIYGGSLRGAGDTRWPMVITFFTSVCIRLPGAYIGGVVLEGGLIGAWCGMWADNIIRFLLMLTRYTPDGWQRVKV